MKKYIVSLVLAKEVPAEEGQIILNGGRKIKPDISIQNEVYVLQAMDADEAYTRCYKLGVVKHPGHKIVVNVVIEMNEALAEDIN